ncbi:hypothetical protein ACTXIR_03500 [Psychrobacter glacincola]|uniref:hypothetical protein n=1 Tax=Psychrobacter glacincola TaxID=56810 RepID=UPI003FD40E10
MIDLDLIKKLSIDKSDWVTVKFGDIVYEPKESVKDPIAEGIEHVVGLEHIDSEDIYLRRSASIEESTTFTKRFRKDDVLFGRRRAYLKKAAKASFDGICSGDITVMRTNNNLLPGLLPFIVNNDKFFDFAITHSAGGLSPRVKFKDLSKFELLLPPPDIQDNLLLLLSSEMNVLDNLNTLKNESIILKKSMAKKYFKDYRKSNQKIGSITSKVGSGVTPKGGSKVYQEQGILFIRSQNVQSGYFDISDAVFISENEDLKMKSSRVNADDVLLNITGASIGRSAVYNLGEKANVNQHVCILRTIEKQVDPMFLCEFLNSFYGQQQIQLLQAGGNREGLNFANIKAMKFPNYDFSEQIEIRKKLELINETLFSIDSKITSLKKVHESIINQVF